jgi:hypothetical protein
MNFERDEDRAMERRRSVAFSLLGAGLLLASVQAGHAQMSPFWNKAHVTLSPEDYDMLFKSAAKVNEDPDAKVGTAATWENPKSTNSGITTIMRVYTSDKRTCHTVQYKVTVTRRNITPDYDVNWCLTKSGWRIAS